MSDLIDRDKAMKVAMWFGRSEQKYSQSFIKKRVMEIPSARPKEGKWLLSDLQSQADNDNGNYAYVCTNCNHTDIHAKTQKVPYCWWCGTRMKGVDDEADND